MKSRHRVGGGAGAGGGEERGNNLKVESCAILGGFSENFNPRRQRNCSPEVSGWGGVLAIEGFSNKD